MRVEDATADLAGAPSELEGPAGGLLRALAHAPTIEPPLAPGHRLGEHFTIVRELGAGGMGQVYLAFDTSLDRAVAIKVHRSLSDPDAVQRLRREAKALAQLSHPNVINVFEVGEVTERLFIVMEYVDGVRLDRWQSAPERTWAEILGAYQQAGQGLAAAHRVGLVHRDFKPHNVMVDSADDMEVRVRVLDFGLARRLAGPGSDGSGEALASMPSGEDASFDERATRTGTILGTPAYMPPEGMRGQPIDERGDQFSFCVALYEALYGARPYPHPSMSERLSAIERGELPPAPPASPVPSALHRVLQRGLSAEPDQRWDSMEALLIELRALVAPPARRGWLLGGAGVVALAGVLGYQAYVEHQAELAHQAERAQRCQGARERLSGVWDEARQAQVRDAILGTELPYAGDAWRTVDQTLGDYADRWVAAHGEVCEATAIRGEQSTEVMDLRMACLGSSRMALREAVGVLAAADAGRVQRAVSLVDSLPPLSRCDDVEALQAELPPPTDPEVAAQVEAQREQLERSKSLQKAGVYEDALTIAESVVEQTESIGYPPLRVEALVRRGNVFMKTGEYERSMADLEQAFLLGVEHGHDRVATSAVSSLAFVMGYLQSRHEAGLQWGRTALARARGPRGEPAVEAAVLTTLGSILRERNELDEALDHHQRSLALGEQALGPDHLRISAVQHNLGLVLTALGRYSEALEHLERAKAIIQQALGSRHPKYALALGDIGNVYYSRGDQDLARETYRESIDLLSAALGPDHPRLAGTMSNMAVVLYVQGRHEESLRYQRRALAIKERTGDRSGIATAFNNIGNVLFAQKKWSEALGYYQQALAIREDLLGPDHPLVSHALHNIGSVRAKQERWDEAADFFRRSLAVKDRAQVTDRWKLLLLLGLAEAELMQNRLESAREVAQQAITLGEASPGEEHKLAHARFLLGRALWPDRAQRSRARALAEQGYAVMVAEEDCEIVEQSRQWLAEHPAP